MGHYKANLRDIEFNLFQALEPGDILDSGSAGELDSATTREILAEVARFAQGPVAESSVAADRTPPVFLPDQHTITVGTSPGWTVGQESSAHPGDTNDCFVST